MFGDFLRVCREKKGVTQHELAFILGYSSPQFVSNWERNLAKPPLNKARQIANHLDIPVEKYRKQLINDYKRHLDRYL